jgi:hypothetical protein
MRAFMFFTYTYVQHTSAGWRSTGIHAFIFFILTMVCVCVCVCVCVFVCLCVCVCVYIYNHRHYQDFIKALLKLYSGCIQALLRLYSGSIKDGDVGLFFCQERPRALLLIH